MQTRNIRNSLKRRWRNFHSTLSAYRMRPRQKTVCSGKFIPRRKTDGLTATAPISSGWMEEKWHSVQFMMSQIKNCTSRKSRNRQTMISWPAYTTVCAASRICSILLKIHMNPVEREHFYILIWTTSNISMTDWDISMAISCWKIFLPDWSRSREWMTIVTAWVAMNLLYWSHIRYILICIISLTGSRQNLQDRGG